MELINLIGSVMIRSIMYVLAIAITIAITHHAIQSYKLHRRWDWFRFKSFRIRFSLITVSHLCLLTSIWLNTFNISLFESLVLLLMGTLLFILWIIMSVKTTEILRKSHIITNERGFK